jgi:hypothetical protein
MTDDAFLHLPLPRKRGGLVPAKRGQFQYPTFIHPCQSQPGQETSLNEG